MRFGNKEDAALEIKINRQLASAAGWLITLQTQKVTQLYYIQQLYGVLSRKIIVIIMRPARSHLKVISQKRYFFFSGIR